jgi:hypothetical protein
LILISAELINVGTLTLMFYGQDRGQCEVLMNTVINVQFSYKAKDFFEKVEYLSASPGGLFSM